MVVSVGPRTLRFACAVRCDEENATSARSAAAARLRARVILPPPGLTTHGISPRARGRNARARGALSSSHPRPAEVSSNRRCRKLYGWFCEAGGYLDKEARARKTRDFLRKSEIFRA